MSTTKTAKTNPPEADNALYKYRAEAYKKYYLEHVKQVNDCRNELEKIARSLDTILVFKTASELMDIITETRLKLEEEVRKLRK